MTADIPAGFAVIDLDREESQTQTLANEGSSAIAITDNENPTRQPGKGNVPKWLNWMDQALVRPLLATDPLNYIRGSTASKWAEVSIPLEELQP